MVRRPAGHRLTAPPSNPAVRVTRLRAGALTAGVLLAACASCTAPAANPTADPTPGPTLVAVPARSGTLLAPSELPDDARQEWVDRLDRTTQRLASAGLEPLDDDWDGQLLVELPATAQAYAQLAGADSADAAAISHCPPAGARITVNPAVGDEDPAYLDTLLLHEGVHIATGSSCAGGRAPLWVEEGLAEWVACEPDADCLAAADEWVAHHLAENGTPAGLPEDADFRGSPRQVSAAYALARPAVASAVERLGRPATMALLATYYRGAAEPDQTQRLTAWYLADLQQLSGNAPR